jgi:hypothetical protein
MTTTCTLLTQPFPKCRSIFDGHSASSRASCRDAHMFSVLAGRPASPAAGGRGLTPHRGVLIRGPAARRTKAGAA